MSQIFDIAEGLAYLHTSKPRIIHGDLKGVSTLAADSQLDTRVYTTTGCKVNILITHEHRACLADFGLASVQDS